MAVTKPPYRPSPFRVYLHSDSGWCSIKSVTLGYAVLLTGRNSFQREIAAVKYCLIGSVTAVGTADGLSLAQCKVSSSQPCHLPQQLNPARLETCPVLPLLTGSSQGY